MTGIPAFFPVSTSTQESPQYRHSSGRTPKRSTAANKPVGSIIDALKLVLLTQSNEYIRPVDEDFYKPTNGDACSEFKIDCTIDPVHLIINGTGVGCFKAAADGANTLELNARFIGGKDSSNIAPIMLYNQMHKTAAPAKSK